MDDWYRRKFPISELRIATAGSCFAQHIGRELRESGYSYVDVEPAPSFLPEELRRDYGYNLFSARYGNIYTPRQLLQLLQRATGQIQHRPTHVWKLGDGVVDAFRPTLQPEPFGSVAELEESRDAHLAAVLNLFETADLFVFTLGLTEAWVSADDGAAFPICPGAKSGGKFDPALHRFANFGYAEVVEDMEAFLAGARRIKPGLKVLLTVSPVPLVATATQHHIVTATTYSKSVLRAAAGHLSAAHDFIDYFPSFEIISSTPMRSQFYDPDMRGVSPFGVAHVMKQFFKEHPPLTAAANGKSEAVVANADLVRCDEELLAAVGPAS